MRLLFISCIVLFKATYAISQNIPDCCDIFKKTMMFYSDHSFYPIDPGTFNINQFQNDFLSSIDPNALYYSIHDFKIFNTVEQAIKDDYSTSYCLLESQLVDLYKQNLESTIEILQNLKSLRFDFNKSDSIYLGSGPSQNRYKGDKKSRSMLYLKSVIIQELIESTTQYDSLKQNPKVLLNYMDSLQARRIQKEINQTKRILDHPDEYREKILSAFVNGFLTQYDPYAYLFSNDAYNDFRDALSSNSSYFGFQLESNKQGEIIISSLIPGSAAWKTGMINTGDKVLKFETENHHSIVIAENDLSDIADFLSDITTEKLTITLSKADKKIISVDLYREKLENTENSVQAFILKGEHKVGYIILPAFYTSWESQNQFGCAQDVGRAIYYLKKENIESLIIDLRNNSGGSIGEAIELAGIFIDFGTFLVGRNKSNELSSIKDMNRGTLYSDPIAILVNSNSASASEMVAAVLQDYNRAIIVGDTTYGKATGQILLPITQENETVVKITTNKYYRVTGESYNYRGVIPDIVLPDYFSQNYFRGVLHYSDNGDFVNKKTYYNALPSIPKDSLRAKSRERMIQNNRFKTLQSINQYFSVLFLQKKYLPLDFENFYKMMQQKEWVDHQMAAFLNAKTNSFTVGLLPKDEGILKINKYYADIYNAGIQKILADPYIEETINILNDYTHIKPN